MKVFISAFRTEYALSMNARRHSFLKRQVTKLGLSFQTALGCYAGSRELSIVIECTNDDVKNLLTLANFLEQECIMIADSKQVALIGPSNEPFVIGSHLVEVSEDKALSTGNYSKIEDKFFLVA